MFECSDWDDKLEIMLFVKLKVSEYCLNMCPNGWRRGRRGILGMVFAHPFGFAKKSGHWTLEHGFLGYICFKIGDCITLIKQRPLLFCSIDRAFVRSVFRTVEHSVFFQRIWSGALITSAALKYL